MIYKDVLKKIEKLRKSLYLQIEKYGIDSNQALVVSKELDLLIEEFYHQKNIKNRSNIFENEYKIAYDKLKYITKRKGAFPSIKMWNNIAKKNMYLSNKSIEYISGFSWEDLRLKIKDELNI